MTREALSRTPLRTLSPGVESCKAPRRAGHPLPSLRRLPAPRRCRPRPGAAPPRPAPRRRAPPPAGPLSGRRAGAGGVVRSARSSGRGSLGRCPGGAGPARAAAMVRLAGAGRGRARRARRSRAASPRPAAPQSRLCGAGGAVACRGHRQAGGRRCVAAPKFLLLMRADTEWAPATGVLPRS